MEMRKLGVMVLGAGLAGGLVVTGGCKGDSDGQTRAERTGRTTGDRSGRVYGVEGGQMDAPLAAMTPQDFVNEAASGGLYEVESSRLALQKSDDPETQAFAQRMIDDHTRANDELKTIAEQKGLAVPARMQPRHQRMLDELRGLDSDAFTRRYQEQQEMAHEEAMALFGTAAEGMDDADLRGFAAETEPILADHHQHITAVRGGM